MNSLETLASTSNDPRHVFVRGDIGDGDLARRLLAEHGPRAVINFAAESHVDRSIHGPREFIHTNVVGTCNLLESVRGDWSGLPQPERASFRFLHVSTGEVHGSLGLGDPAFSEMRRYEPDSPYSASKAASDPLPGNADTADDRERVDRQEPAGLRRRHAGSRLALRVGPM